MRLVQLRYVVSVANTGSFSCAARRLSVSQPTVSNAVADLEEELHVRIFRRTTRSVELTCFGSEIIGNLQTIVGNIEAIESLAAKHAGPQGRLLRVAYSPVVDGAHLFGLLAAFAGSRPGLHVIYKESSASELAGELSRDRADLVCGIRLGGPQVFGHCPVYREPLRYLPQRGPAATTRSSVALTEIAGQTMILPAEGCDLADLTRELFLRQHLRIDEYPGHPLSYAVLQEWTQQGFGAAILPESKIRGDARAYPLITGSQGWPERVTIEASWRRSQRERLVRDLVGYLKEAARIVLAHRRH
jgi:LysR family transcriptional regulator, hydrogen peroxide-inducible genes activator